jgi:hypothetical protein
MLRYMEYGDRTEERADIDSKCYASENFEVKQENKTSGSAQTHPARTYLRWDRNLPVACPDPSQPGMGHLH